MPLRQFILILAIASAFGVLVPMYKGLEFLDRRLIVAYACLSAVIAAPIATDAFAARAAEANPLRTMLRVWFYSWGFAVCLLALALVTVNVTNWRGRLILPRTSFLVAAECLSITIAAAAVALAALLTSRFSAQNVNAGFRALFLIAVVALFLADRYSSQSMTTTAMTRLLFMLSSMFGAAALAMHAMLSFGASHSRDRRGSGGE